MQDQLRLLIELQKIDDAMNRIRVNRRKCEKELDQFREEMERVQGMADSLAEQLAELERERRERELSLAQERDNVQKAEGRLPAIKTQKEYVAVLKEIDTAKKLSKELEEQIASRREAIETLAREKEEKAAEAEALNKKHEARQAEIRAALEELDESLAAKEAEREEALKQLPSSLRRRYEMLLERRSGVAVVEARNGACLGCNMHLPPQLFNSLFLVEEIQSCPHCNRLLYVREQA